MDFEPFYFFFLELQEVQSQIPEVVQQTKFVQAFTLAVYTTSHNNFMQVILIEAEEALYSNNYLKIPDPYTWLLSKQKIFLPRYYLELKKNILRNYLSYVENKDKSLKDRDMTLFENALKRPLSTQLAKQNVFLYNALYEGEGDRSPVKVLPKKMPLFLLGNLQALLKALETIVTNRKYAFFGLNQIGTKKFNSYRLYDLEKEKTNNLIGLINYIIPQVYTTWKTDEKELDDFQTEYHELFCYDTADILPLTYITSSYLSTMRGFTSESIWKKFDPFINSVWQWDGPYWRNESI